MSKKKEVAKFKLNGFFKHTPIRWKKIGYSILTISAFISGNEYFNGRETWSLIAMVLGLIGKVLTEFFTVVEIINEKEDVT